MSAIRLTRAQRLRALEHLRARRLLQILQANLATATDAELRARLQRAIEALREKWEAA
jgi:hypothetical protein